MGVKDKVTRASFGVLVDQTIKYIDKDREKSLLKITDIVENFIGDHFEGSEKYFDMTRDVIKDPTNKWMIYANNALDNVDPHARKQIIMNLGYQSMMVSNKEIPKNREELGINVPWTILFDPTSACNKRCIGCWAAEYGHNLNLSFDEMDKIVSQGKDLGIYFYMLTGGEPLVRKRDVIKLAEKHNDCYFNIFSNGSLIDQDLCEDLKRVGNIAFSLSVEGYEGENDGRRGDGSFDEVMHAMDLLRENGLVFGTSMAYTSKNYKTITSDDFLDLLIEKGAYFAWYFHYMPVGKGADTSLLLNAEQREYMYHRIKEIRALEGGKSIFTMDFQNDGPAVGGCIAGGRNYFHINSNGDAEPCVFIHYSDANIRDMDLVDILRSPLFAAYRDGQPFNDNHLKPCPMLENPHLLKGMVDKTGAKNTDLVEKESPAELEEKTVPYAEQWDEKAEELWAEYKAERENK